MWQKEKGKKEREVKREAKPDTAAASYLTGSLHTFGSVF